MNEWEDSPNRKDKWCPVCKGIYPDHHGDCLWHEYGNALIALALAQFTLRIIVEDNPVDPGHVAMIGLDAIEATLQGGTAEVVWEFYE